MQVPKPCLPSPGLDSVGLSKNQHFNTAQVILMGVDADHAWSNGSLDRGPEAWQPDTSGCH